MVISALNPDLDSVSTADVIVISYIMLAAEENGVSEIIFNAHPALVKKIEKLFAIDLRDQRTIWRIRHRRGAIRQITQGHKLKTLGRQSLKPHECAHPKPHTPQRLEPHKADMKSQTQAGADQTVQKTHGAVLGEIRGDQDMINCPSGLKNG